MRIRKYDNNMKTLFIIYIFAIGTLISSTPMIGNIINKVLYFMLIFFVLIGIFKKKLEKKEALWLLISVIVFLLDVAITRWPLRNSNELYYFITWVLFFSFYLHNYSGLSMELISSTKTSLKIILLWECIVFVSFFVGDCYVDSGSFASFAGSPHRMDSSAVLILSMILIQYRYNNYKKIYLLLTIIPIVAVVMSGVRTYLGVVGAIVCVFYYYTNIKHKARFYLTFIPLVILGIIAIKSTSIMQARMETMELEQQYFDTVSGYNALAGITSGRSVFWQIDIKKFWETSIINRFIGNGFNFVRDTNYKYYGNPIWAHNDFINIICCNGIMGLVIYFKYFIDIIKCALNHSSRRSLILLCLFVAACMINAMFNMLYTYFAAAIATPILAFAVLDDSLLKRKQEVKQI